MQDNDGLKFYRGVAFGCLIEAAVLGLIFFLVYLAWGH